ncbi:putative calcium-binding protein CML14 [Morus notabilis]|uniref:Putative calcium-binding protein CML14 n=1 Tax=Morus notabilis TaxID=981085 RepID=W9RYH1_9ROSA|nr:putative calcium-binding protein CML14 [Morus notabilis]
MKLEPFDHQLHDAFKVLDKDATGFVSLAELRHILTSIGEKLEPAEFGEWIREVDVGSDRKIRYEDFIAPTLLHASRSTSCVRHAFPALFRIRLSVRSTRTHSEQPGVGAICCQSKCNGYLVILVQATSDDGLTCEGAKYLPQPPYPSELYQKLYPLRYETPSFMLFNGRKGNPKKHISRFLDALGNTSKMKRKLQSSNSGTLVRSLGEDLLDFVRIFRDLALDCYNKNNEGAIVDICINNIISNCSDETENNDFDEESQAWLHDPKPLKLAFNNIEKKVPELLVEPSVDMLRWELAAKDGRVIAKHHLTYSQPEPKQAAASKQTAPAPMTIKESYPTEIPDWYFPGDPFKDDDFLVTDEVMAMFPDPGHYLFDAPATPIDKAAPSTDQSSRDSSPDH